MRLILAALVALASPVSGQEFHLPLSCQNFESRIYAPDSMREIAVCKVDKIFPDHRRLGFFKVNLLPVLVVQGVHVEFAGAAPTNEWAEAFQSDWLPKVKCSGVEWRDVSIASQKAGAPRLHAGWAQPAAARMQTVCVFKDVTLEANGVKWRLSHAELCNEDGRPCVVWHAGGSERRMDLFSGKFLTTKNRREEKNEKTHHLAGAVLDGFGGGANCGTVYRGGHE